MESLATIFKKSKQLPLEKASVSLYVIKRYLQGRDAHYSVFAVKIDDRLAKKLCDIAKRKLDNSNAVREYDFTTSDLDNDVLGVESAGTDFEKIIELIKSGENVKIATNYQELIRSWMYIARFDIEGYPSLYSARKVSTSWQTQKVTQFINLIFRDNMLIDLAIDEVFSIDRKVDFFSFDGALLIADKKSFESALNFRAGMLKNRDEILDNFKKLNLFVSIEDVAKVIGDNMHRLRKLSQVKKAGYYQNERFLSQLRDISAKDNWGIEYDREGKITITDQNIDKILLFLNNDRLFSKLTNENFDVDVKHKVS